MGVWCVVCGVLVSVCGCGRVGCGVWVCGAWCVSVWACGRGCFFFFLKKNKICSF